MAENPEDKRINESQGIERIEILPMRRKTADFSEIVEMMQVCFQIFPNRPDVRYPVAPLKISGNAIKSECNAQEGIGPQVIT